LTSSPARSTPGAADNIGALTAELATRGRVAVFPVTGWWKELPSRDQSSRGARYALLLSIESPAEDVDLWTPVAQEVGLPVVIETELPR
jgi:hypothetical protein